MARSVGSLVDRRVKGITYRRLIERIQAEVPDLDVQVATTISVPQGVMNLRTAEKVVFVKEDATCTRMIFTAVQAWMKRKKV